MASPIRGAFVPAMPDGIRRDNLSKHLQKCVNKDIMSGGGDQFFATGEYTLATDQQLIDGESYPVHHVRHLGAEHFCK